MSIKKQIHFSSDMGRMGNQMFQYACAKGLSHNYGFVTSLSHLDKMPFFKLGPFERLLNKIKGTLFFRVWKKIWGVKTINTELDCLKTNYLNILTDISSPTMVWGFFQSPLYFEGIKNKLKKDFEVKEEYKKDLMSFYKQNNLTGGAYIAVHLRRTDYKGFVVPGLQGDDFTLPISYYKNTINLIANPNSLPIVFVSDDPEVVEELFPEIGTKIISRNDAITDFQILQNASVLVTSNSTFAWWAAYLNDYADNNIYCPKYFLGFKENKEIPVHIYPENWKQVQVY
ncbi:MAG: alpha-1,2-fucosyltransferase [Bacteroidota bacterium]